MTTGVPPCSNHEDWKPLYRAAILEKDMHAVQQKALQAEHAALARERELFHAGGSSEEQELLEDALYALRAFRSA